jgi:hypothetical protein
MTDEEIVEDRRLHKEKRRMKKMDTRNLSDEARKEEQVRYYVSRLILKLNTDNYGAPLGRLQVEGREPYT